MSLKAPASTLSGPSAPDTTLDSELDWSLEDDQSSPCAGITPALIETLRSDLNGMSQMINLLGAISQTSSPRPSIQKSSRERSDALSEVKGLEIGLDLMDELEDHDRETIYEGEDALDAKEGISGPVANQGVLNHSRVSSAVPLDRKPPSERLEYINYLERLHPTTSGRAECPFCHESFDMGRHSYDIADHFWDCDVRRFKLSRIPKQSFSYYSSSGNVWFDVEEPTVFDSEQQKVSEPLQRHSKLRIAVQGQLPSAIVFLTQLRTFCDGQLTCIGPKCKGTIFFDPSWDDLKSHYARYHADFLVRDENIGHELDIDFHLTCHKRDVERLFAKARLRREEWISMDQDTREMEKARCRWHVECECSTYRRLKKMPQFGILKDLNKVFRSRYRRFHRVAADSPSPNLISFIDELREKGLKAKDLRRIGTRTFKQVIQGTAPTTLLEIFAFISLSQAMAIVMRGRGIQIDLDPGTIDYLAWRVCIEDKVSRDLYDEILLAWFHPRWKEELASGGRNQTSLSVQVAMETLVLQLMKANQTNGAFNFSAFLRLDLSLSKQAHQEWIFPSQDENCEPNHPPVDTYPNEEEKDDPGDTSTEALISTAIFIGVYLFMIFISGLGVVLLYLSNPKQQCYILSAAGEEHVASVYDVVLAAGKLRDRILHRLGQNPRIPGLDDILTAAEEVLDSGYAWSVSDLHIFLEQAVQNHVQDPGLHSLLYTEIRRWCKEALNWVEPICERHRGGCMFVPVAV
ncbi:hypothetical protein CDV31_001695 [Fusarium ambrosium]|uniref:Uncharacterized protein n=1 Tax=Fusarium ambrosium TaxID=131363 RepID=A0A428UZ18_9HYPO|nr:hypothetical protein CDV31_001695 [Fusarium ambrosium]